MNTELKNLSLIQQDQKQRQIALKTNQSFIVRAPAGSGKTSILTQRYLKLLSIVNHPEEIIAITFTKKAAKQMRDRIVFALKNADQINDLSENKIKAYLQNLSDFEKQNYQLARAALRQDRLKNWQLLNCINNLKIKTIDAYIKDISNQLPFSKRNESPIEDISFLAWQAAIRSLDFIDKKDDKFKQALQTILPLFAYNYQKLIKVLVDLLGKREQWLSINFDNYTQSKVIKNIVQLELKKLNQIIATTHLSSKELNNIFKISQCIKKQISFDDKEIQIIEAFISPIQEQLINYQEAINNLLLTGENLRKRVTSANGLPSKISEAELNSLNLDSTILQNAVANIKDFLNENQKNEALIDQLLSIKNLPIQSTNSAAIDALFTILKYANAELELLLAQNKKVDFSALLLRIIDALGETDQPTDLSLYLDYQVKHLLIDEFQDVSKLQVELIRRLTAGWDQSTVDNSLFLVGDPMQSIYRFRQANVYYFNKIEKEQKLGQLTITALKLSANFRSNQDLVVINNDIFANSNQNNLYDAVDFKPSVAIKNDLTTKTTNYNCFYLGNIDKNTKTKWMIDKAKSEQILITPTIAYLKNLIELQQKNIAIIFPKRSAAKGLIEALKSEKINYQQFNLQPLKKQIEIQDMLSLTESLFDFNHYLAWFSLLRSRFCALALTDLLKIKQFIENNKNHCIFTSLIKLVDENFLHIKLTKQSKNNLNYLIKSLKTVVLENTSLSNQVEKAFQWLNTYNKSTQLTNIEQYLKLLHAANIKNALDLKAFKFDIDKAYSEAKKLDENTIQLMTIHNAKGLEFDHVICWSLDSIGTTTTNQQNYLLWDVVQNYPIMDLKDGQNNNVFSWLNFLSKQKLINEKKRLFYVALTRAKKSNLVVFTKNLTAKNSVINKLNQNIIANSQAKSYPPYLIEKQTEVKAISQIQSFSDENNTNLKPLSRLNLQRNSNFDDQIKGQSDQNDQNGAIYYWAGITNRVIGIVCHLLLEKMADIGSENLNQTIITKLKTQIPYQIKKLKFNQISQNDINIVEKIIDNVVNCKKAKFILSQQHKKAENELKITYIKNQQLKNAIIDRTFIDSKNERWIIDYKTSFHSGADLKTFLAEEKKRYLTQLNLYCELINKVYGDKNINCALYFPLLKKMLNWQWQK